MKSRVAKIALAGAVAGLALAACKPKDAALPALPEFAAGQRAGWQHAPLDAQAGVVVADPSHVLERLRALRTVVASGKVSKSYLDKGAAFVKEKLGFDPLDDAGWKSAGFDTKAPLAVFGGKGNDVQVVLPVGDVGKAQAWLKEHAGDMGEGIECAAEANVLHCGAASWKLAPDAAHSLWPHIEKNVPLVSAMEIFGYAPLDQGEFKEQLAQPSMPFHEMSAGYMGMTMAPERVVLRGGAVGKSLVDWLSPYLQPRAGTASLVGLAADGTAAGRFTFSPDVIWARAQKELGKDAGQAAGIVQAATGFDLQKDIVDNLTGEIVWAAYRAPRKGSDGKERAYIDRLSWSMVVGTRDDAVTRRISDHLGEMIGGAIGTFGDTAGALGLKLSYRADAGDRKVHWVAIDLDAERSKAAGISHFELGLTSVPGGLAMVFGAPGIEELRHRAGNKPQALLGKLPYPELRAAFQSMPLAMWSQVGDEFVSSPLANKELGEMGDVIRELTQVAQLIYDGIAYVNLLPDRVELVYQVTTL